MGLKSMTVGKDTFFTIVIPTRERSSTLLATIASVQSQGYDNLQILVSDNASLDGTQDKVAELNDSRIRYINTGTRVSMSENWEFALDHVSKGWVTVLGDDDALLPGTLAYVNELIKTTGTTAIRSNDCSFRWPCLEGERYGVLRLSLKRGYEIRDSGDVLQKVMAGRKSYIELPMLYSGGFVSMELIAKAKKETGKLFRSMTPDVYTAIAFGFLTDTYLYSHEPLAINGASSHSGGTAGFEKIKRKRSYDPAEKFWSEPNIPFHDDLPLLATGRPVRSIPAIVYEAYLQAEPFHTLKAVRTTSAEQLELILRVSGPDPKEISEWALLFAHKHGINIPQINKGVRSVIQKVSSLGSRLLNRISTFVIRGSRRIPLRDVHEASIVAGFIKELRPNVLQRLLLRSRRISA